VVGYLVGRSGDSVFQARATVYLGQPLSATGAGTVQSFQNNPATVNQIAKSAAVAETVAAEVGVSPDLLRDAVATQIVRTPGARAGEGSLAEIIVRGPWREQSAEAANLIAERVASQMSRSANAKIATMERLLASQNAELDRIERQIEELDASLTQTDKPTSAEALRLTSLRGLREQQRTEVVEDLVDTELTLTVARDIESGQVIATATARPVDARSSTTSMIVGGVIGLLVGVVAALAWGPTSRWLHSRRRAASA